MFASRFILLSCILLFPALACAEDRMPNVIFILADDLGTYELGCFGQKKIKTPHIDQLASKGIRFTHFYAGNNVCAPSRCCLLTGKHPGHATIRDNREARPEGQHPINADEFTLPAMMKQQGYTTATIGKWGLGMFGSTGDPLRHGIDYFFGYNCQRHAHYHYPNYLYRNAARFELPGNNLKEGNQYSHDLLEEESLKFIRENRGKPFFLYLPYIIPHVSISVPESELNAYRDKLGDGPAYDGKKGYIPHPAPHAGYAAMVSRLDKTVGKIVALVEELMLSENTLIIFTSDNGPTHNVGGADSTFFQSAGHLRGLKGSMYEGGLRVPFIATWKGKIKPNTTCETRWAFWDVLPTMAELTSAKLPEPTDGISFLPTLLGQPQQRTHDFLFWESPGYGGQQAVIAGNWKAVRQQLGKQIGKPVKTELYDLEADESEKLDISSKHPEMLARLEDIMKREHVPSAVFPLQAIDPARIPPAKK